MKNKILPFLLLFFYISINFAQNDLNGYKYVIIPKKYDSFTEENKYQINSLTKFLFEKNGYTALFEYESYPDDLKNNPCLAVTAKVNDNSKMLSTKVNVELIDCYNKVVFTSVEGKSKEKDYKKGYQEALRGAFITFEALEYSFDSSLVVNSNVAPSTSIPVETVKIIPTPALVAATDKTVAVNQPVKIETKASSMVKSYKNDNISFFLIEQNNSLIAYVNSSKNDTYKKGEKIGTLKKTSRPDVYRISWKNKDGVFENTTGYFDEKGNLNVDIEKDGNVSAIVFEVEN